MAFSLHDDDGDDEIVDINMVPLIDVMLVLMIVFMVTAPLLTHAVKLELPRAASSAVDAEKASLRIEIDAEGRIHLDDAAIDEDALPARFAAAANRAPDTELRIRADRRTPYGTIARVMSLASRNGLARIGFVTDPRKDTSRSQ
ncbi:MAG TPA: biopolymer transporter ExbD [Zeimonas sp.]